MDRQLRSVWITFAGENDDFRRIRHLHEFRQKVETVAVRQTDIEKKNVEGAQANGLATGIQGMGGMAAVCESCAEAAQGFADFLIVIDYQNGRHGSIPLPEWC